MKIESYRDLQVWQKAIALTVRVYNFSKSFPREEIYVLTSQSRRCVVSIASNIAEGHSRESLNEYLHFLSIAMGSLSELETQLIISGKLEYVSEKDLNGLLLETNELARMLKGLQKSLKERRKTLKTSLSPIT